MNTAFNDDETTMPDDIPTTRTSARVNDSAISKNNERYDSADKSENKSDNKE